MNTAVNLMLILAFLSALYTLLGLLGALTEQVRALLARRPTRRRAPRTNEPRASRRRPRRTGPALVRKERGFPA